MDFETLRDRIAKFDQGVDQTVIDLCRSHQQLIVSLNVDDQLYQGQNADGSQVSPAYTPFTIRQKKRFGDPYDRVTLRDTGDFHRSFSVVFSPNEFTLVASDPKAVGLERKYGSRIYGLTDASIDILIGTIFPELQNKFKTQLGS